MPVHPMQKRARWVVAAGAVATVCAMSASGALVAAPAAVSSDPYLWLEDPHGERVMSWVKTENDKTTGVLEKDPHFAGFFADAKQLAEAKDRIPTPEFLGGDIYNFWQDAEHTHGVWRRTSLEDYQRPEPHWQTVLDLDALSHAEHANWFWKGAVCREPAQTRCLIKLSDGGEDAITVREFDLPAATFVADGFALPSGKTQLAWESDDTLLVSREWTPGEITKSGYPFVVKRLRRGQALGAADEVFRGKPEDVWAGPVTLSDGAGRQAVLIEQGISFFRFDHYVVAAKAVTRIAIPHDVELVGMLDGHIIAGLHEDWHSDGSPVLPTGSLVAFDYEAALRNPGAPKPSLIYAPGPREAFVAAAVTRSALLVHTLDNVNGRAWVFKPDAGGGWSKQPLPLPDKLGLELVDGDLHSARAFMRVTGFLTPSQLLLVDLEQGGSRAVKTLPAKFDASRDVVEQFEVASKDGTRVPYFVVHPAHMKMDGTTPTIEYAYGGFLDPITPTYSPELGKLWLEHGGAFVLANIRGGGEFGPKWHDAGLKTHRQRIFDDFYAVAQDVVKKGFTSPAHLGIRGGSNGGLLMGVQYTQHPDMWRAVDIEVPLLDMLRFEQIAAGSSWVAEYGSVSNPVERRFLASISPYHNLKTGVKYPQALIWSTTKDDRVGPQHARKFAARLGAMKVPYFYYEVTEGGHGSGSTPQEHAHVAALEYTYFTRQLGPGG